MLQKCKLNRDLTKDANILKTLEKNIRTDIKISKQLKNSKLYGINNLIVQEINDENLKKAFLLLKKIRKARLNLAHIIKFGIISEKDSDLFMTITNIIDKYKLTIDNMPVLDLDTNFSKKERKEIFKYYKQSIKSKIGTML